MIEPQEAHSDRSSRVGQLDLLLSSPRVAPGLLSYSAWQALTRAERIFCSDPTDPLPTALAEQGLPVQRAIGSAADQARELLTAAATAPVLWLGSPDADPGLTDALAGGLSAAAAAGQQVPTVELIVGSHDLPGARLLDVVAVLDRLRSPGGCPWVAEQGHRSLAGYLLEEAHEVLEAIEVGSAAHLCEELGDILLQVIFHARVAADAAEPFDIDAVAGGLVAKLIHRHPHVFDPAQAAEPPLSIAQVEQQWQKLKDVEKQRTEKFAGLPPTLPALARAHKVLGRVELAGADLAGSTLGQQLLAFLARAATDFPGEDPELALLAALREVEQRQPPPQDCLRGSA